MKKIGTPVFIVKKVSDYVKPQAKHFGWKKAFYSFVIFTMAVAGLNFPPSSIRATAVPLACQTGAVTLLNPGFETPVADSGSWSIFPSGTVGAGWTVGWADSYTDAPAIANLELHNGVNGWTASEGSQYAELDSDWDGPSGSINSEQASVVISQIVAVVPFATYQLSFKLSPRPGTDSSQNNVRAQFGSIDQTNSFDGTSNSNTVWSNFSYPMVNDSSVAQTLKFTDLGIPDSYGMFIDDVRLELTQCPVTTGDLTICKYNDLNEDGIKDEDDAPLQWPFTVRYPDDGGTLSTGTNADTGCVTIEDLPLGEYVITEDDDNTTADAVSWVKSNPTSGSQTINLTADGARAVFLNYEQTAQPDTTFHFIKAVCPQFSDVAGNQDADNVDATGGQYVNFSNYQEGPSFSPAVTKPINPSEIPSSCVRQAGWQFKYSIDQAHSSQTSYIGPTDSNGETTIKLSQMVPEQQSHIKGGGQLWVSEELTTKPNDSTFAAIRCYTDAVNGDNLEFITLGTNEASYPSDVYCVAYNVGEIQQPSTGTIRVCKYEDENGDSAVDGFGDDQSTPINPLSGWTINITDGNEYSDSKVTGDDGCVDFTELPYASYSITETTQPNWTQTFPGNNSTVIDLDASYNWTYFLNHREPTSSIHGYKWNDLDGDGQKGEERLLSGWTVFIDEDNDGQLDDGETSMVTSDSDEHFGWYWFENLPDGDYSICEVSQTGWTQTYPENCHSVTLPDDNSGGMEFSVNAVAGPEYNFGNKLASGEDLICKGSGTYTLNADFDKGALINVNYTPANQLQLDDAVNPFGFIWVANSGEGTIVKMNTETGEVMGEYKTSPDGTYGNPSRTTVDKDGSVWVGNRQAVSGGKAAITHVGLVENGQCEDRNNNGVIDTSTGLNDVKAWTDESGARGVATAQDECIVHFTKMSGSDVRHISVDSSNNIWVSGTSNRTFEYVKGGKYNVPDSGTIIRTEGPVGYGGYGGLIDSNNVIWSAANLLRWDTANPLTGPNGGNWTGYSHSSYGLCIDSQGNVFNTEYGPNVYKHAPDGTLLATFSHGTGSAQGCVVDKNDDLWVAGSLSGSTVDHLKNDGTFVGSVSVGSGPTGVAVDNNGKIWVTNHYSQTVMRIDPTAGPMGADGVTKVGAVDFTSSDIGGYLYNYSDMTGSTLSGKAESGTWTVIHDGEVDTFPWKNITWNADVPSGATLSVTVAPSADGIIFDSPISVTNGQSLSSITARYLKVVVSFQRSSEDLSPVLYDLTVNRDCGQEETNNGGSSSGSTSGGGGSSGGSGIPVVPGITTPTGQVLGETTFVPSSQLSMPQVLGESTTLPRTGMPISVYLLVLAVAVALLDKKLKLV